MIYKTIRIKRKFDFSENMKGRDYDEFEVNELQMDREDIGNFIMSGSQMLFYTNTPVSIAKMVLITKTIEEARDKIDNLVRDIKWLNDEMIKTIGL